MGAAPEGGVGWLDYGDEYWHNWKGSGGDLAGQGPCLAVPPKRPTRLCKKRRGDYGADAASLAKFQASELDGDGQAPGLDQPNVRGGANENEKNLSKACGVWKYVLSASGWKKKASKINNWIFYFPGRCMCASLSFLDLLVPHYKGCRSLLFLRPQANRECDLFR